MKWWLELAVRDSNTNMIAKTINRNDSGAINNTKINQYDSNGNSQRMQRAGPNSELELDLNCSIIN